MNQAVDAWFDNKLTLNLGGENLKLPPFLTEEVQVETPEPIPIPLPDMG